MIALAGRAGFYGAPVTKFLLCHAVITYFLFTFPLHHFLHLFHYNQDVFAKRQFKRMFLSKLVFLNFPNLIFSTLLMYNFRIFERRFGSRKFISYLLSTTFLASLLELLVFAVLNKLDIRLGEMPSGLFSMMFPLYVPFYNTIPRVALTKIIGVPVTGKTLNYILGLQIASSDVENGVVVGCAIFAGLLWRFNFLMVQTLIQVPQFVGNTFDQWLGRFLESADSQVSLLPMGATLELQQRERLDKMEQQMFNAAMQASRRMEIGRPQPLMTHFQDTT
uniref:Peptidase S54 rhomboid domain-containing protein n=1 Tax=Arion vulgaris TaxID=1028688 RepID=A0A0B7AKT5_9EUPU